MRMHAHMRVYVEVMYWSRGHMTIASVRDQPRDQAGHNWSRLLTQPDWVVTVSSMICVPSQVVV